MYLQRVKDYLAECKADGLTPEEAVPDLKTYLVALARQKKDQELYFAALQPGAAQKLVQENWPD